MNIDTNDEPILLLGLAGGCGDIPEIANKIVAAVLILTIIYINCSSVKVTSMLITVFGFGKMISLAIIIIAGVVRLSQGIFIAM